MSRFRRSAPVSIEPDEVLLAAFADAGIGAIEDAVVAYADSPPILMPAELSSQIRHRLVTTGSAGIGVWEGLVGPTPGRLLATAPASSCRVFRTHRDYDEYVLGTDQLWISRRDRPKLARWFAASS